MNIPLDTSDTLMKYIGALPNYIRHTLLLLNPTNLDEASVQATHIERMGKYAQDERIFNHSKDHFKGKVKDKRITTTRKDEKKALRCTICEKDGHDRENC